MGLFFTFIKSFRGKSGKGVFLPPTPLRSWKSLKHCLFGGVKLAKNTEPDKYGYTAYDIGFNLPSEFSLPDGSMIKIKIIFGLDISSPAHIDNKK